jgi:hypothetical protein
MNNALLIGIALIVIILIFFRMTSFNDTPPPPKQKWFLVNASAPCPEDYSKPDTLKNPTVCKLNNS